MNKEYILAILYNEKTTKYHPIIFRFHSLPEEDTTIPRYKSVGHHTKGFISKDEAIAECEESKRKLEADGNSVGLSLENDFLWDGEEIPGMVLLFTESNGKYISI